MSIIEVRDAELSDARHISEIWLKAHAARLHGRFDVPADLHQRIEERMRSRDASYVVATDASASSESGATFRPGKTTAAGR